MKIDVVNVGPQKTGTTWLWKVMRDSAQLNVCKQDCTHLFDLNWNSEFPTAMYSRFFADSDAKMNVDFSASYIRSAKVLNRIYRHNPNVKIIYHKRDPLERAFSHYWHEKKKGSIKFSFDDVLKNYDLYESYIVPSRNDWNEAKLTEIFPKKNLLCVDFAKIKTEPESIIHSVCDFLQLDYFESDFLKRKVNAAKQKESLLRRASRKNFALSHILRVTDMLFKVNRDGYSENLSDYKETVEKLLRDHLR